MKKILLFFILIFNMGTGVAQTRSDSMQRIIYLSKGLMITVENNYIGTQRKGSPVRVEKPIHLEYMDVTGPDLNIAVAAVRDSMSTGGLGGRIVIEDATANIDPANVTVKVYRSPLVYSAVTQDTVPESYSEMRTRLPSGITNYYTYHGRLLANDNITIECWNKQTLFLVFKVHRLAPELQPYLMAVGLTPPSKKAVNMPQAYYTNAPGAGLVFQTGVDLPTRSLYLFFRTDRDTNDVVIPLRYRLIWNNKITSDWKVCNNLLVLENLLPNSNYTLDVGYNKADAKISTYYFSTSPVWYQNPMLIIIFIVMLIAVILYLILKNTRRKHRMKSLEMQAIRAQMNPHFLFNALSSIQGLMNSNQIDEANKYFADFSRLLRSTISQSRNELIPLSEELRNLKNYIDLEKLRFGFRYTFDIDPAIHVNNLEIPPLLAQPLIENAIKHGLSSRKEDALLVVSFQQDGKDLRISINDNGNGYHVGQTTAGHGIQLTRNRISLFNRLYKHLKIQLEIQSDNNGTQCLLLLKNWIDK